MPKRKLSSARHRMWWGVKLVVSLSIIISIIWIQSQTSSTSPLQKYSPTPFSGNPKIAFLFLAKSNLPLDFLWDTFFQAKSLSVSSSPHLGSVHENLKFECFVLKNGDGSNFSIHIHSRPGFVFDESTTRSAFFYGRQLRKTVQVVWGESSMIEAERLLLEAALEDPANQRFILLSESCVPLYNFSYIYNYVMSSPKSFVDSFLDTKEGRYNPKMSPKIPKDRWRKGSQWITLVRKHAVVVANDDAILSVFKRYCKRRPDVDLKVKGKQNMLMQKQHNCIPDEHYLQTLLAMWELEHELERRTLTFTSWNQTANNIAKQRWHPVTFEYSDASLQHIKEIKRINHVYYETEYRTEWCHTNGTLAPCFLFARKFSRGAAMRLLSEGLVGPFDAAVLLSMAS
ncbi:hypothetical protein QJS04_geneDACA012750 [Acorus gramineus]|uniref:Core-2/I-branching beta-1,6-N-acetylglucosaminyltransferase family protein n=1 Tax=Acorus gramineus TaxID=55184 RepID=A0AAV9A0G0_ACOGR|nr:hypothetical protein QJS04_geneDACA012750 [Acorus gramineus]